MWTVQYIFVVVTVLVSCRAAEQDGTCADRSRGDQVQPNIVLIIADDLGYGWFGRRTAFIRIVILIILAGTLFQLF